MWSVKNDEESLETAAVTAAREQMVTACSIWASVESHLALKIKLTAWTCMARQPRTAGSRTLQNEGTQNAPAEQAFSVRFSTRCSAAAALHRI